MNLVADYIKINGIKADEFKDGKPGDKWFKNFMKRNKLSSKKAEMISTVRRANTWNPFIMYDFFDQLEKVFQEYPELNENKIYNCDESGFSTDQTRCRVVSVMRQPALKLSFAERREKLLYWGYVVLVALRVIHL